jgi:hypothetical protein
MIHDLNDSTKHGLDVISTAAPVVVGTTAALTMNQIAALLSVLAAICSIVWFGIRVHDRLKYGPGANK